MGSTAIPQYVAASVIEFVNSKPWNGRREGLLDELFDELAAQVTFQLGRPSFYEGIATLEEIGLVRVDRKTRPMYVIETSQFPSIFTRNLGNYGYDQVRTTNLRIRYPFLHEYAREGGRYLEGVLSLDALTRYDDVGERESAPAADRVVNVDHNSPSVQRARSAAVEALRTIESSNSLRQPGNDWIGPHINAGLELLKQRRVLATAITALLLKPLYTAYSLIAEDAARKLILAAIEAIKSAFGI